MLSWNKNNSGLKKSLLIGLFIILSLPFQFNIIKHFSNYHQSSILVYTFLIFSIWLCFEKDVRLIFDIKSREKSRCITDKIALEASTIPFGIIVPKSCLSI